MTLDKAKEAVVGMSELEAKYFFESMGYTVRVVQRDDNAFILTMEYRYGRINLVIRDGKVAEIPREG